MSLRNAGIQLKDYMVSQPRGPQSLQRKPQNYMEMTDKLYTIAVFTPTKIAEMLLIPRAIAMTRKLCRVPTGEKPNPYCTQTAQQCSQIYKT